MLIIYTTDADVNTLNNKTVKSKTSYVPPPPSTQIFRPTFCMSTVSSHRRPRCEFCLQIFWICSVSRYSVGNSLEPSRIQFTPPNAAATKLDSFFSCRRCELEFVSGSVYSGALTSIVLSPAKPSSLLQWTTVITPRSFHPLLGCITITHMPTLMWDHFREHMQGRDIQTVQPNTAVMGPTFWQAIEGLSGRTR